MWLPPPASYSRLGTEMQPKCEFSAFYKCFQATSSQMTSLPGHCQSCDVTNVIFCCITAPYCKLQSCSSWNAFYELFEVTSVQMMSLPGHFHSHDVFLVMWLPPYASDSPVGSKTRSKCDFLAFYSRFLVTSAPMTSLLRQFQTCEVTWHHFLSCECCHLQVTAL